MAQTKVACGATTTAIVAANASRDHVIIANDSDVVVYFKVGASAVLNEGIRLAVGEKFEMRRGMAGFSTLAINGIASAPAKNVTVYEI